METVIDEQTFNFDLLEVNQLTKKGKNLFLWPAERKLEKAPSGCVFASGLILEPPSSFDQALQINSSDLGSSYRHSGNTLLPIICTWHK